MNKSFWGVKLWYKWSEKVTQTFVYTKAPSLVCMSIEYYVQTKLECVHPCTVPVVVGIYLCACARAGPGCQNGRPPVSSPPEQKSSPLSPHFKRALFLLQTIFTYPLLYFSHKKLFSAITSRILLSGNRQREKILRSFKLEREFAARKKIHENLIS